MKRRAQQTDNSRTTMDDSSVTLEPEKEFKVYKRRWVMLLLSFLSSAIIASHWLQYSGVRERMAEYYRTEERNISWTAHLFLLGYLPLALPALVILYQGGTKAGLVTGQVVAVFGSWTKISCLRRDCVAEAFVSQALLGCAQSFTLSVPPRLAALWFPPSQVPAAAALGHLGQLVGLAVGRFQPPLFLDHQAIPADFASTLRNLHVGYALLLTGIFLLTIWCFKSDPKLPPSPAQVYLRKKELEDDSTLSSLLDRLLVNRGYIFLLLSSGFTIGVFYALIVHINQVLPTHYSKAGKHFPKEWSVFVLCSLAGPIIWGVPWGKVSKFKMPLTIACAAALVGMYGYTFSVALDYNLAASISLGLTGFSMSGFLTVAYGFAAELTCPVLESGSCAVINAVSHAFGAAFVFLADLILYSYDELSTNFFLCEMLFLGLVGTFLIPATLVRLEVYKSIP